ncbi:heavy metal translocating P-type ATPase [Roseomonas sp. E05]|uniref:heavy metal translocating P-type ATPase n=1 Tax=Roseomonas sp. E05 TaxID=3046310 RepID=UPI0024BAF587|nr:heavy metal translocating P-type ATPase [Roseomonas sp. E05]MDJ0387969.1 heavy metal translocating P-type ATPase [Roseomonas sp. E05]
MEGEAMESSERTAWRVSGMDCAACVAKVTRAVERLPGVSDVTVNLMTEELSLRLAPEATPPERITRAVSALGYSVSPLVRRPAPRPAAQSPAHGACGCCHGHAHPPEGEAVESSGRAAWRVSGMDCAACVAKVTRAVERLPGVSDVTVNLMTEELSLRLAPEATPPERITQAVAALGYSVSPLAPRPAPRPAGSQTHEDRGCGDGHAHPHEHAPAHTHAGAQAGDHAHHHHGGLAHAHPAAPGDAERPWHATAQARLVAMLAVLVGAAAVAAHLLPAASQWLYLAATLVALVPFSRRAWALARAGSPFSIEALMVVAAAGAAIIGAAGEAAMVVLLFAIGEMLESVAAGRARAGIRALVALMPRTARREGPGGAVEEVPADRLAVGEVVLVRPGDRVPCDGEILEGRSALDESPVTGESMPVARGPGEPVVAGSVNAEGVLRVRVTHAGADSTLARIARMVAEATASRGRTQRFIERFSAIWTPAAMAVAAAVILLPPLLAGADWATWLYRGLALLLIACPCALVISVPAAMAAGLSAGARHGLLVRGGAALEAIGGARTVAFDKTGTLTQGRPRLTDLLPAEGVEEAELLRLAAALEAGSAHPLARAVLEAAATRGVPVQAAREAAALPGQAVTGTVEGRRLGLGSPAWAEASGAALPPPLAKAAAALEEAGKTVVVLVAEKAPLGLLALRDEPRADAAQGVAALGRLGVGAVMLTGDNPRTGAAIGAAVGLPARAGLRPEGKLAEIAALRREGAVIMVGDGINDAPALAAATAGVAMGGGTDVALEAADAALMRDRVGGVAELVALSRSTLANVRQNVALAVGLKLVFLGTTVVGATGLWAAIMADTGATVLVTMNALRLLRWRPPA